MAGVFMMRKFIDWAKINKAFEVFFEPRLSDNETNKFKALAKRLGMSHFANAYRRQL
jgi:Na+-transporting NADH:ubiquinone oxidoreductase subunit NqrC